MRIVETAKRRSVGTAPPALMRQGINERMVDGMKRYNVICLGYKEPDKNKIKEFLEFEKPENRNILLHPYCVLKFTDIINPSVIQELENSGYSVYYSDACELSTKYDYSSRKEYKINI